VLEFFTAASGGDFDLCCFFLPDPVVGIDAVCDNALISEQLCDTAFVLLEPF